MKKTLSLAYSAYRWFVGITDDVLTIVLKKTLAWLSYLLWLAGEDLGKYRTRKGYSDRFEKKHSKEDLFLIAMFWPHSSPISIRAVQSKIPFINKNDAAMVANMAKDKVGYLKILQKK